MENCIFCRIVKGEIPGSKVYEDESILAFDDIHPMAPVHVIIIPKTHIPTLLDLKPGDAALLGSLNRAVQEVARIKGIDKSGFRTVVNTNKEGGQIIFHMHVHVLGGRQLEDGLG
ncbi:MAG: histidine triad nucleotide-binding protein [Syntrophaceae bacterium]